MKWVLAAHDAAAVERLAAQAGISPLLARLLAARGITDAQQASSYLSQDLSALSSPRVFEGMDRAVERIRRAIGSGERITVYGDYDVDGVTGASLLYLALRELGAVVDCYIPDRMAEGYGLNAAALRRIRQQGASVVITVDCGITAVPQAEVARSLGIDLIITDHHESASLQGQGAAPEERPDAFAVIHPWLLAQGVPDGVRSAVTGLTGVGVAFKLVQALHDVPPDDERLRKHLDLVALGTIADVGTLRGENRVLVRYGLERLSGADRELRPGIAALKAVANLSGRRVNVGNVGFAIAPRINASGRLGKADTAFRLLTTDSADEANELAARLDRVNRERQVVEEGILDAARARCVTADLRRTGAFVLASDQWHPGVVGIVASRVVDEFYRPTALIAVKDGVGKGSARSIAGFDLYRALSACSDLLLGFGGHKYAAGLTVAEERIPELRERLSALAMEQFGADGFVRTLSIDAPVTFGEVTLGLLQDLDRLAPFGQGNPEPKFGAKRLEVTSLRQVGTNRHLKIRLRERGGPAFDGIAYGKAETLGSSLRAGAQVAAVFSPKINRWNGLTSIELEIKDIKIEK